MHVNGQRRHLGRLPSCQRIPLRFLWGVRCSGPCGTQSLIRLESRCPLFHGLLAKAEGKPGISTKK